jgi:nicotinamide riboside kinase
MSDQCIRIAVSGSFSSGKTTTTEALSVATGIPRTHAMTSREIIADMLTEDGHYQDVQELSAAGLLALGLRRLEERVHAEAAQHGSFVSDGSVLHEWIYGVARMQVGINPGAPLLHRAAKRVVGLPAQPFFKQYMNAYGIVTKRRAKRIYDVFIHLPVEFEMQPDGHRPVSEQYRKVSDDLLLEALDTLQIPFHVVGGSVRERVERIVELLDLPLVVPLDEAIEIAHDRVRRAQALLEEHKHADLAPKTLRQRVRAAVHY